MASDSTIDEIDCVILGLLQGNSRTTNVEIARQVAMAPSAVLERIRKLEDRGFIQGYSTRLNAAGLGYGLLAFVFVRSEGGVWQGDFAEKLSAIPEVQEVHHVAGEDCFLVKVRTRDTASLGTLIREAIGSLPSVRSTRTTIVLETAKETMDLPIRPAKQERKS
jgi:Lrp/AsnC family leucine-responsive transcriptional regulator